MYVYIYIDTKFSYDNNVHFSIFREHRQLKHGIHFIDPSTDKWLQVATSGYNTSGFMWLKVVLCGFMWLSCFMWLSFYVAKSDEKWIKLVISCG